MTDDAKWERLKVDAAQLAKDRRRHAWLPAVILKPEAQDLVDSLAKQIERLRERGEPTTGITIYTTARGRHVRVTVEEVPDPADLLYAETFTGVVEKVARGPAGSSFAVSPSRTAREEYVHASGGRQPIGTWLDFPVEDAGAYDGEGRSTLLARSARVTITVEREALGSLPIGGER